MKVSLKNLPKLIEKTPIPQLSLPSIQSVEESYENESEDLESQGREKTIVTSNIIDVYTRLEIILGLKLSGHTIFLTKAGNQMDEQYKRSEI